MNEQGNALDVFDSELDAWNGQFGAVGGRAKGEINETSEMDAGQVVMVE